VQTPPLRTQSFTELYEVLSEYTQTTRNGLTNSLDFMHIFQKAHNTVQLSGQIFFKVDMPEDIQRLGTHSSADDDDPFGSWSVVSNKHTPANIP
jgi:hypothetical protein